MTDEEAAALVKSLVPPGSILIGDSEKYREVLTGALVTLVARAVADERERCAQIAEYPGRIKGGDISWNRGVNYAERYIAAAIRRGEP